MGGNLRVLHISFSHRSSFSDRFLAHFFTARKLLSVTAYTRISYFVCSFFFHAYLPFTRIFTLSTIFTIRTIRSACYIICKNIGLIHASFHACLLFTQIGTSSTFLIVEMLRSVIAYAGILCFFSSTYFHTCLFFSRIGTLSTLFTLRIFCFV